MGDFDDLKNQGEQKAKQAAQNEADKKLGTDNNQQGQQDQQNQQNGQ